jgi:hypothetical protein
MLNNSSFSNIKFYHKHCAQHKIKWEDCNIYNATERINFHPGNPYHRQDYLYCNNKSEIKNENYRFVMYFVCFDFVVMQ